MKLWRKRTGGDVREHPDISAAKLARIQSEQSVKNAHRDWARIHAVTEPLRAQRITNGFGEMLEETFRDVR